MLVEKDIDIIDILSSKPFTFSAELVPPRNGLPIKSLFAKVEELSKAEIDFISITRGAGGSLRGGTIPIAFLIKEKFDIPVIAHFTCMESTSQEIENNLLDHSYLGITNILALRGDPSTGINQEYIASDKQHQYAHQLIEQINELKQGKYILRKNFDKDDSEHHDGEPLNFCIGAAAYPNSRSGAEHFAKKVEKGAVFGITQMNYYPNIYADFLKNLRSKGVDVPVLPGFRVITKPSQVNFIENVLQTPITDEYKKIIQSENKQKITNYIIDLIEAFYNKGAKGVHFFVINEAEIVRDIINLVKR